MKGDKQAWIRVTRKEPCVVCGHDGWCQRSADGAVAHCMRVKSEKPARSEGWIHRLDEAARMEAAKITPERRRKEVAVPVIDWTVLAKRMATDPRGKAKRQELATTLGVSEESLEALWVGVGFDREPYWSFPEREPSGRVCGIVRRYADGRKKTMPHGHHGLYYAPLWWSLPGPVFLVEGGSDTAALITLGVSVVGRPSNLGGVKQLTALLRGRDKAIVVVGENDEHPERRGVKDCCTELCQGCGLCWPGKFGAVEVAARLSVALRRTVTWCLPPFAKDARDWLVRNPGATAVDWLIAQKGRET